MSKISASVLLVLTLAIAAYNDGCSGTSSTPPTITSTTATNARLYTTSTISVTFSTAMDHTSVEAAFQITGSGPAAGTFSWTDNTVTFTPSTLWKTHHPYALTIQNTAKSAQGAALAETFTQSFKPSLNMHDVNGDGIDDIIAGAPHNDQSGVDSGMAYLFLGKTNWSNVNLSTKTADAQYNVASDNINFGWFTASAGDINGDGYADMLASAPRSNIGGSNRGLVAIIYGSATPTSRTFQLTDTDADILIGGADNVFLGFGVYPAGDVNGDGFADFLISGAQPAALPPYSQFWLVLGRAARYGAFTPITDVAQASFIVTGSPAIGSQMYKSCDVNGDELDDIVLAAPTAAGGGTMRGQVYYVAGSTSLASLDLRTQPASATFTGAQDNNALGLGLLCSCADINADGYDDMLMGAPPAGGTKGIAYLVLGSASPASIDFSTGSAQATFTGDAAPSELGYAISVPGDVNRDGFNDMLIGAPLRFVSGAGGTGTAYLFTGSATPVSVDLSAGGSASATYSGSVPLPTKSTIFGWSKPFGDINGDGIDDMVMSATHWPNGTEQGIIYIVFGSTQPVSLDFNTQSADVTITGQAAGDMLSLQQMPPS